MYLTAQSPDKSCLVHFDILFSMQCCLLLVLSRISLMTHDFEPLFMCLLVILWSSVMDWFSNIFPIKKIGSFSHYKNFRVLFYILSTSALSDKWFANIVSLSMAYHFIFLNSVFQGTEVCNFGEIQFINWFFCGSCFMCRI